MSLAKFSATEDQKLRVRPVKLVDFIQNAEICALNYLFLHIPQTRPSADSSESFAEVM